MFTRTLAAGFHLSRLSAGMALALLFPSSPYAIIIMSETGPCQAKNRKIAARHPHSQRRRQKGILKGLSPLSGSRAEPLRVPAPAALLKALPSALKKRARHAYERERKESSRNIETARRPNIGRAVSNAQGIEL